MHVQNRKAKRVKQRRREKRNTSYRLYLLFLHLFLSVYVCCQASVECQSYPSVPSGIQHPSPPASYPLTSTKPPETRITALASCTEEAFFLFSHSTHQKSVQKGGEKKRRGNAASHHQIFSVLNLHTRSILLCLLFVAVGKCGFAFVLH